jgi:tRNA pseudouridine55 synthase
LASGVLPIARRGHKTVPSSWTDGRNTASPRFGEALDGMRRRGHRDRANRSTDQEIQRPAGSWARSNRSQPRPEIDGQRAYDLARAGEAVELEASPCSVERLELVARPDSDHADFVVGCGKGTYIRSLGRDLAHALGTVGHLSALRRTAAGPFREEAAIRFPNWRPSHIPALLGALAPVATALDDIPALADGGQADRLRQASRCLDRDVPPSGTLHAPRPAAGLSLVRSDGASLPVRVFNL